MEPHKNKCLSRVFPTCDITLVEVLSPRAYVSAMENEVLLYGSYTRLGKSQEGWKTNSQTWPSCSIMEERTVNSQTPKDAGLGDEWLWRWLLPWHEVEEIWSQRSSNTSEMRKLGPGRCCLPERIPWTLGQIAKLLQLSSCLGHTLLFLKIFGCMCSLKCCPWHTTSTQQIESTPVSSQTLKQLRWSSQSLCLQFLSSSVTLRALTRLLVPRIKRFLREPQALNN